MPRRIRFTDKQWKEIKDALDAEHGFTAQAEIDGRDVDLDADAWAVIGAAVSGAIRGPIENYRKGKVHGSVERAYKNIFTEE